LAIERVIEEGRYIARDNPVAAEAWVRNLFVRVKQVRNFPMSGRTVRERQREDTREVIYRSHRVIYRVEASRLLVLTVRHARQRLRLGEVE
jgi:plasmid stabilization system protein ParE